MVIVYTTLSLHCTTLVNATRRTDKRTNILVEIQDHECIFKFLSALHSGHAGVCQNAFCEMDLDFDKLNKLIT